MGAKCIKNFRMGVILKFSRKYKPPPASATCCEWISILNLLNLDMQENLSQVKWKCKIKYYPFRMKLFLSVSFWLPYNKFLSNCFVLIVELAPCSCCAWFILQPTSSEEVYSIEVYLLLEKLIFNVIYVRCSVFSLD